MIPMKSDWCKYKLIYMFFIGMFAPLIEGLKNNPSLLENISDNGVLDECVTRIIKQDFTCKAFITFAYLRSDVNEIIEAINKDDCQTVNLRTFESKNWTIWNEIYIIITEDYTELYEGLEQLKYDMFWNPRAHFVISTNNINNREIQILFQTFLTFRMYKVVFIDNTNNKTEVHTYRPFHDGNCGRYIEDIENHGNCSEMNPDQFFPINITTGLINCKLKAVKYSYSNISSNKKPILEQYILDTFANHYHYSIEYTVLETQVNYGVVLPNRTVTGLLGELDNNAADIAVGSTVIIKNRADVFDFICGFKIASFKLFTSALGKEMWKKVYTEFDSETWAIILILYVFMILICIMLLNFTPKIPYSHTYLIVKLWGFFYLGNGTEPYSRTRRLRSVTAFWIWFTFFISSFYNSDMYSLITGHVQRKREIEPEHLNSIPYRPCISTVIATFFFFAYNEKLPKSLDISECRSIDDAFKTVADGHDLYTVQLKESYDDRQKHFIDNEGNRKLDVWDFSSDIVLGFYLSKGFPLRDELQMVAQRLYENGLVDYYLKLLNPSRATVDHRKKNVAQPFVLGDFRVHFGVLFLGSILSTMTFLAEIVYNRKRKNQSDG